MNKEFVESLKNLADVVAVCLFGWLIIKAVVLGIIRFAEIWRDSNKERNALDSRRIEVDTRRNELDEKIALIVSNDSERLKAHGEVLTTLVGELKKLVSGDTEIKNAVAGQHKEVINTMDKHDTRMTVAVEDLKLVRDQQYNALNSRLDIILKELGDVKDSIKALPTVTEKVVTISDKVENISEMVLSLKDQIKVNEAAQEKKDNGG